MKLTIVVVNPEGDSVVGLYIDRKLAFWGEGYHDHIDAQIIGYIEGMRKMGWAGEISHMSLSGEHPKAYDFQCDFPESLDEFPLEDMSHRLCWDD